MAAIAIALGLANAVTALASFGVAAFVYYRKTEKERLQIIQMRERHQRMIERVQRIQEEKRLQIIQMREHRRRRDEKVPLKILDRGPAAVEAYNKALLEGKTRVQRVPVMIVGQQDAGKTSLKKSLTGEMFNAMEKSTEGIEADPDYFKVSTETWKTGEMNKENDLESARPFEHSAAARLISKSLKEETSSSLDNTESAVAFRSSEKPSGSSNKVTSGILTFSQEPSACGIDSAADNVARDTEPTFPGHFKDESDNYPLVQELPEDIAALVQERLQSDREEEETDVVYSVLWDFAGQNVYYDTHPVFLTDKGIYILVSDLSRNIHEKANPRVRNGIYKNTEDVFCTKTNLDCLDFWMSSICSLNQDNNCQETALHVPETSLRLPPVFLVCTHADKPFDYTSAKDLSLETFGCLRTKNKTYREHLFQDVFAVDNTKSGSEHECPEVVRLRKELLAVAKELPQMKEEIPLKWLRYEKALLSLRQEGFKWIDVAQARDIASEECRISDDVEFSTLLNYLHDQRILIHFTGSPELETMVILDPQWLIDVFKKVITVKRFDQREAKNEELWQKLQQSGILDEKLLDDEWKRLYANQETLESLLAIMERFSLLCPWPSSETRRQYLVPSMLMSPPTDDVLQLLATVQIPPLFLKFASGLVPPGLFSRLILQFFQWCDKEWESPVKPQLFKDFAMFHIRPDEGSTVTFLCHSSSIEIIFLSGDDDLGRKADLSHENFDVTTSRTIYWQLTLILECMRKEFFWLANMRYEMCVCCPVCSKSVKCRKHGVRGCEECLHFLSQWELHNLKYCERAGIYHDCRIHVQQYVPWFSSLDRPQDRISINKQQAANYNGRDVDVTKTNGRRRVLIEGMEGQTFALLDGVITSSQSEACVPKDVVSWIQESLHLDSATPDNPEPEAKRFLRCVASQGQTLSLPDGVITSIQSEACAPKDIVSLFQESLQLDPATLANPEPETKRKVRFLAIQAKSENRTDVVKYLREITPAGTTGPLLNENLDVRRIPFPQRKELTFCLSGGEEWKLLAERLGLSHNDIRFLDKRVLNPCDVLLDAVGRFRYLSVGEVYETLVDCELPAIADIM